MACFAAIFISLVKLSMFFVYPVIIIYIVQTVGAAGGQGQTSGDMANGTLHDGPWVSLQLHSSDIIIGAGIFIGPNGMRTAMTRFAGQSAMSLAVAKQGSIFLGKSFVCRKQWRSRRISGSIGLNQADSGAGELQVRSGQVVDGVSGVTGLATGQIHPGASPTAVVVAVN